MAIGPLSSPARRKGASIAPTTAPLLVLAKCLAVCVVAAGCAEEVKVIRYDPFLAHLPGAEGGKPPVGERPQTPVDPMELPPDQLIVRNADGTTTLVSRVVRHLVGHLARVMQEEDDRLLYDQLVSEETKLHFSREGQEPRQAILEFFRDNHDDVIALLSRMPAAERSPGVVLSKVGPKQFKLVLSGTAARGLKFTELWVVMEKGNWRLWWFA